MKIRRDLSIAACITSLMTIQRLPCLWAFLLVLACPLVAAPANALLILSDDHRYDFMSFMEEAPEFLETPNLDRLAKEGAHLANAFVSTSLCSPSRASILTGQYMRNHRVVDNQRPVPPGTRFFPEYLREAATAPVTSGSGTWAMKTTPPARASTTGSVSPDREPISIRPSISTAKEKTSRDTTPTC